MHTIFINPHEIAAGSEMEAWRLSASASMQPVQRRHEYAPPLQGARAVAGGIDPKA
jgi:hypothetical protein